VVIFGIYRDRQPHATSEHGFFSARRAELTLSTRLRDSASTSTSFSSRSSELGTNGAGFNAPRAKCYLKTMRSTPSHTNRQRPGNARSVDRRAPNLTSAARSAKSVLTERRSCDQVTHRPMGRWGPPANKRMHSASFAWPEANLFAGGRTSWENAALSGWKT
jgi:hypothetical protein